MLQIVSILLGGLTERVNASGWSLEVSDAAKAFIGRQAEGSSLGARPLRRAIQRFVEDPLSEEVLNAMAAGGDFHAGGAFTVDVNANGDGLDVVAKPHMAALEEVVR